MCLEYGKIDMINNLIKLHVCLNIATAILAYNDIYKSHYDYIASYHNHFDLCSNHLLPISISYKLLAYKQFL